MFHVLPLAVKQHCTKIVDNQLTLMAALLLEASIRHFSYQHQSGVLFFVTWTQLMLECSPLLLAHYMAFQTRAWRGVIIWLSGFLLYPLMSFSLAGAASLYAKWSLFSVQGWLLVSAASLGYGINQLVAKRHHTKIMQLMSGLLSLNSVLLLIMFVWSLLWAGIFVSTDDPVRNQPIKAVIDSASVFSQPGLFFHYLWQFLLMGAAMMLIYWLNRYVLIRKVLARQGLFAYVAACLISIIVLTPLLSGVILWLPMNIPEFTFLPSQDYNPFAPINFRFCFLLLAVSTPIILAFERQQNEKALAEIAQRQSQTELQLLQQQVNPHFLFNTLNNVYALTLTSSPEAPKVIMQLANLLRYTVYEGQQPWVSVAQEITYLQDFLALQAIRSQHKCQLNVEFADNTEHWQIRPLLLIILLENAFKHGVEPSQSACTIDLSVHIKGKQLVMQCDNTLPAQSVKRTQGIGLHNLKRRLDLLYGDNYQLSYGVKADKWCSRLSLELIPGESKPGEPPC